MKEKPSSRDKDRAKGLKGAEVKFTPEVWRVIEFLADRRGTKPASMMRNWIVDKLEHEGHLSKVKPAPATQRTIRSDNVHEWEEDL